MQIRSAGVTVAIALVASVLTSFFVGRLTVRDAAPTDGGAADFKAALQDVERALADIRQLLASQPLLSGPKQGASPELRSGPPSQSPAGSKRPVEEPAIATSRPAPPRDSKGDLLPPADFSRAEEIHEWESKEDVRRRWFLVSEADVLAVFGTPTLVDGEKWIYENDEWGFTLQFLRGRLVNVYSMDKRRR